MAAEATIGYAILAALLYSVVFFAKKAVKAEPDEFEYTKLGATLIIGAILGVIFYLGNIPITAEAVEIQLVAYAGVVALVESILKIIYRILIL